MASGQYFSLPAAELGLAPISAASVWGYGSWERVVSTGYGKGIYVTGLTFQITNTPALDTTIMYLFEIGTGASGSEVTQVQIPYSIRADTLVGYFGTRAYTVFLPEPMFIAPGTRIAVRAADSLATAVTYEGVKIMYRDGNSPTVALNTPLDGATVADTTPTLNFTGTDIESDTIEYDIQIDTVNTFNSGTGTGEDLLVDSHPIEYAGGELPLCITTPFYTQIGQTFNASTGGTLIHSAFQFGRTGVPVGTMVSKLYAHTGTYGTTGIPTGAALATSAPIDVTTYAVDDLVTFDFSASPYTLVAGTKYAIVTEYLDAGSNDTQAITIYLDDTPTHAGSAVIWNNSAGNWGAVNNYDTIFYVYVKGPYISANSATDVGFTAGHPFTSGSAIDYTVQSALPTPIANNTYYWRVKAIDPLESGQYGAWSATRSFIVPEPPFVISGTTSNETTGTIRVAINNVLQAQTGSFSAGTWSISGVTKPASGAAITVFISDAAAADLSTAVTIYSGGGAVGGMVLDKHVLSIGSDQNRSIVLSDLAKYDYDQDTHILNSANGAPATLLIKFANGSSYVDEKINILSGNTLTIGATETLSTYDLSIAGTLIGSGAATINVAHDWANSGTFTAGSSTVTLGGTTKQTLSGTLNSTSAFYNLTITNNSGASASDDERTGFTPSVDFDAAAKVSNNYTITTANVRVEYQSGATYEFDNINWAGTAGNEVQFRNSDITTTWLLKVTGTQTVSYADVSRSDASVSGGLPVNAYDGTNYDAGNNTNWSFTNTRIRQEINLFNGSFASLNTQTMSVGLSSLSPASNYSGTLTNYFEIVTTNTHATIAYTVYLRNWVGDAIIAQLTIPALTNTPTRIRSSAFTFPSGLTTVYTNGPQTAVAGQVVITASRVIVYQDIGSNPLTSTETQIEIGNYEVTKSNLTPGLPLNYPKYWLANDNNWDGTKTFYAEACYRTTTTATYCTFILQKDTAGDLATWVDVATVVNAAASSSANYPMLSARVAFTPVSGCNYRIKTYRSSGTGTYNIYNAKIIVSQTGTVNILEPQYLLLNTYNNTTGLKDFDTSWDPADWQGSSNTYYHEINSSSDTADAAKLQSDPNGTPADVTGSTATGAYRARSSALTMPLVTTLDTNITNVPISASRIIVAVNNLPAVVLNTPTDSQYVARLTPTLNCTGTSPSGNNLEYNVQIDTVASFNSVQTESSGTLFTNGFEAAGWTSVLVSGSGAAWSILTASVNPAGIAMQEGTHLAVFNSFTCAQDAQARYYPGTTFNISSNADTASLTFWMYHESQYSTDPDSVQLQISTSGSGGPWVNAGTAVIRPNGNTGWELVTIDLAAYIGINNILIGFLGISSYGNDCHIDNVIVSYHIPPLPLLTKYSVTNPGFTAGHPFVSGVAIDYSVQPENALSEIQYFWRARATSSGGSPAYGSWSAIYDFTVALPTVTLNSPTNAITIADKTPTVNFTGTSLQPSGTLEYNVQIDKVNTFNSIGLAWDVSYVGYAGVSFYNMLDSRMYNIVFSADGKKMYIVGNTTMMIYQCSLVVAWDISTALYDYTSYIVNSQDTSPRDLKFSADGTKMYVFGSINDYIYQYTLSTAWNISTATYSTISYHVTIDTNPYSFMFGSNGTKLYVYGHNMGWIYQYTLSTAWNISTATSDSKNYNAPGSSALSGLCINSDGTRVFANDSNYVYQFVLSTPWDISTATYSNVRYVINECTNPSGLTISSDGTKMYLTGYDNGTVYQYNLVEALISEYSDTGDADFTSGHPFSSAQAVDYTSNSALVLADMYDSGPFSSTSLYSSTTEAAQSFVATYGVLDSCIFNIKKYGLPTGNVYAKLYTHSGTYGTSSIPTGAALATSGPIDISGLTTTLQNINFTFSGANRITLTDGAHYCVAIQYVGGDSSNRLDVGFQDEFTTPSHSGNRSYYNSVVWTASSNTDLRFMVYVETQCAGIYYWRVAAKDPLGTYGAWSSTRTFTVSGMKTWNGSSWDYKPAKVRIGSNWETKPVKVWDGSGWVIK